MGFEIKNICTIVPNAYHPKTDSAYYYFSVFITPKLQFDGTLKEYYEMLNWPEFANDIFWKTEQDNLKYVQLVPRKSKIKLLEKDDYYISKLCEDMILDVDNNFEQFKLKGENLWKKIFKDTTPVEAWPIYLKPIINATLKETKIAKENEEALMAYQKKNPKLSEFTTSAAIISNFDRLSIEIKKDIKPLKDAFIQAKKAENVAIEKAYKQKYESTKFREEFHKKISALARYPHILRLLGLIHDFKIKRNLIDDDKFLKSNGYQLLKFNIDSKIFPTENNKWSEFFKSIQFIRPFTKCTADGNKLSAFFKNDEYGHYNEYITNGFLNAKSFSVDQVYFEDQKDGFKNADQLKKEDNNIVGINTNTFSEDDVKVLKQKVNPASNITKGLAIKVHGQPGDLLTNMDQQFNQLTDENIEDESNAFMAHHLDCGYRVDVRIDNGDFMSLCRREAKYIVDSKNNWISNKILKNNLLIENFEDEPWLEEVRQVSQDLSENRFEEIARWNGWSLTCPPLYKNKSAKNSDADDMELCEIRPITLPKLRFGQDHIYKFRIRIVDICGNGQNQECKEIAGTIVNVAFNRKEPLSPPLLFPPYNIVENITNDENDHKSINKKYKGEDNETLVLRSKVNASGGKDIVDNECIRFITPTHVTPHFAELSGVHEFEEYKKNTRKLYNFLKQIPAHFYTKNELIEGVPFPHDVIVKGISIGGKQFEFENISTINQNKKHIPISLKNDGLYVNNFKFQDLMPGEIKSLLISSYRENKYPENIPLFSIENEFKIIHAVQKPVFIDKETPLLIKDGKIYLTAFFKIEKYEPGDNDNHENLYAAKMLISDDKNKNVDKNKKMNSCFPCSTVGEFVLTGEFCEYELNPQNKQGWSYKSKDYPKEKDGKLLPGTNEIENADKFHIRHGWSNIKDNNSKELLETKVKDDESIETFLSVSTFNSFKHFWPDTKYRSVDYQLEAISKFAHFFDEEEHFIFGKNQIDHHDMHKPFSIIGDLKEQKIYNSAKPSKPSITSILPVFTIDDQGEDSYIFKHDAFRIYLGNNWFETGNNEQIAVIFDTKSFKNENDISKNKSTVIANDPTAKNDSLYVDSTFMKYFSLDTLDTTLDINLFPNTLESKKVDLKSTNKFSFMPIAVNWDMDVQEFYAEISFKDLDHYSTLLKFAVCRYQEFSIQKKNLYDYRFSDVVMTDMVSILPSREVSIINKKEIVYKHLNQINESSRYDIDKTIIENEIWLIGAYNKLYDEEDGVVEATMTKKDLNKVDIYKLKVDKSDNNKLKIDTNSIPNILNIKNDYFKKFKSITIEEYEYINVSINGPNIDDKVDTDGKAIGKYNPRNDPRKRLVFFYTIKL